MIRVARPDEQEALTDLARRSNYWGYSESFMRSCREELTVTADLLPLVFVKRWTGR